MQCGDPFKAPFSAFPSFADLSASACLAASWLHVWVERLGMTPEGHLDLLFCTIGASDVHRGHATTRFLEGLLELHSSH